MRAAFLTVAVLSAALTLWAVAVLAIGPDWTGLQRIIEGS